MTAAACRAAGRKPSGFLLRRRRCVLAVILLSVLALGASPALIEYHLWRGRTELAAANPEAALEHFRTARRIDPDRAETYFWLARGSRKTGDLKGLRRNLDQARKHGYKDRERLRREWWLLLAETGRIREVEPYLAEMLMNPGEDGVDICQAFATGYCLNLDFEKALALLDAWQADFPKDFRPRLRRGEIHAGDEQWVEAVAAYREALRLAPDEPAVRRGLGKALLKLRDLAEAEFHLRLAIRQDPGDVDAVIALAEVAQEQGDQGEAFRLLQEALDREPGNFQAKLMLADSARKAGDAEEAIRHLAPLVELWPEDLRSRYLLAQALRAAGRVQEAEAHLTIYARLERNWGRLEQLNREVKRRPDDPGVRYELGLMLLRHRSRSEGVAWLQSVFQFQPDHHGAHRALAEYYTKIGEPELARRHRRMASVDSPKSTEPAASASLLGDATL